MNPKTIVTGLALLFFAGLTLPAQQTVPATGGDAAGMGGSASFTVGQVAFSPLNGPNFVVSEGVQQAYEIATSSIGEGTGFEIEILAYPNPTTGNLNLRINHPIPEDLSYQVFDFRGVLVEQQPLYQSMSAIDLQDLAEGVYTFSLLQNNTLIKTLRIVKTK